jgi:hypothetical protein
MKTNDHLTAGFVFLYDVVAKRKTCLRRQVPTCQARRGAAKAAQGAGTPILLLLPYLILRGGMLRRGPDATPGLPVELLFKCIISCNFCVAPRLPFYKDP